MRRALNTCNSQSAMHSGVRVRASFRRSSEHHRRNGSSSSVSSSSSTFWIHHVVFFCIRTRNSLRVLYTTVIMYVAFARDLEAKNKTRRTNQQSVVQQKQQQQRQPQQKQAAAAAAAAAAVEAEAAEDAESTSEHLPILYRNTRFISVSIWRRKTAPSSSGLRHPDYPTHVQQSYSYQVPQIRHLPQTLPAPPQ